MKWQRVNDSFIFSPNNNFKTTTNNEDYLFINSINNSKVSSAICEIYNCPIFSLDDITNINFNISPTFLSTTIDDSMSTSNYGINTNNLIPKGYIHNLKITLSIQLEYKSQSGIKIFTKNSFIGDFINSHSQSCSIEIFPQLLCLWKDSLNNYHITLVYNLYDIS